MGKLELGNLHMHKVHCHWAFIPALAGLILY